jgi:hypothetical protein
MSETETLRKSLDAIDSMRRRVFAGGWLAVVVTVAAYARFYWVMHTSHDADQLVEAAVLALTCLVAWAGYATSLIIVRMTKRILRAIDAGMK